MFDLCSYARITQSGAPLTVYIEGDGMAWRGRRLSGDPTPNDPLAFRLAVQDPSKNVVYLARPGQYTDPKALRNFDPAYWSSRRFSEEVVVSANEAINVYAKESGALEVDLVGYSGGGAIAVLIAARRPDVASVRTVAGNLDPDEVNRLHRVSPLNGSLDPIDAAARIRRIPQRHFVGTKDTVVPQVIVEKFIAASENSGCVRVTPVAGATHHDGWVDRWPQLIALPADCSEPKP